MNHIEEAMKRVEAQKAVRRRESGLEKGFWSGKLPNTVSNIPLMDEPRLLSAEELEALRIIYPGGKNPRAVNAFRQLRTSLLRRSEERNFLLLVTGVGWQAGASFVARNLGAAFALDETMTALLIDCNLDQPQTSSLALADGVEERPGLTDFLDGEVSQVEQIIYPTGVPRMRVIPVGSRRRHIREFFTSRRLPALFRELLGRYPDRFIILDVPPIDENADTRILAGLSNMVLLVVPYGRATAFQIECAVDAIPDDRYVGSVVNNEPA